MLLSSGGGLRGALGFQLLCNWGCCFLIAAPGVMKTCEEGLRGVQTPVQAAAGQRSSCLQSPGKPLGLQFPRRPVVFPGACPLGAEGPGAVGENDAGFQDSFARDSLAELPWSVRRWMDSVMGSRSPVGTLGWIVLGCEGLACAPQGVQQRP